MSVAVRWGFTTLSISISTVTARPDSRKRKVQGEHVNPCTFQRYQFITDNLTNLDNLHAFRSKYRMIRFLE